MRNEVILNHFRRHPFLPYEIHMSDARRYVVEHPEFVSCSPDGGTITYWTMEDQRLILLDSNHVTALEFINRPAVA